MQMSDAVIAVVTAITAAFANGPMLPRDALVAEGTWETRDLNSCSGGRQRRAGPCLSWSGFRLAVGLHGGRPFGCPRCAHPDSLRGEHPRILL
jgi:hypothetical protein